MPTYYTTRAEIDRLLRPGQKVQFRKGRGYYLGGQPSGAAPVDPVTQQATSSVEAALAPLLASIERQREDARQQAERERAQLAQYYQWAAGEARNIGPAIGGAYNQAAQTTGAFSKGFSQGMQDALAGNAAEANKLLEQNGAPAGQMLGGRAAPAADALYGLSGALPAQEISAQGAAFSSAAAQLPMTAAGIGGQSLQKMLEEQSAVEKQFADAILEIEQKRPGLIQDAVNELKELALAERNQKLKEAAYEFETGLKVTDMNRKLRNDEFSQAARRESLDLQWRNLEFRTAQAQRDAQVAASKGARPNPGLSKVYGYVVDSNGVPILNAQGKRIPVAKSKKGGGGVTDAQKSVILKRSADEGNKALEKYLDRVWDKTPGSSMPAGWGEKHKKSNGQPGDLEDYQNSSAYAAAQARYQRRLGNNFGAAMAAVVNAIGPHLRAMGWTRAQILKEARRIVGAEITPPARAKPGTRRSGR